MTHHGWCFGSEDSPSWTSLQQERDGVRAVMPSRLVSRTSKILLLPRTPRPTPSGHHPPPRPFSDTPFFKGSLSRFRNSLPSDQPFSRHLSLIALSPPANPIGPIRPISGHFGPKTFYFTPFCITPPVGHRQKINPPPISCAIPALAGLYESNR